MSRSRTKTLPPADRKARALALAKAGRERRKLIRKLEGELDQQALAADEAAERKDWFWRSAWRVKANETLARIKRLEERPT